MPTTTRLGRTARRACAGLAISLAASAASAGPIASVRIETAAGGGPALGAATLTAGDTLPVFAAAYDDSSTYLGPATVNWSAVPSLATVLPSHGTTALVQPTTAGTFRVRAAAGGLDDWSGDLQVVPGPPTALVLFSTPSGGTP